MMTVMLAAALFTGDFERPDVEWDLRNAAVVVADGGKCARLRSVPGDKCWVRSPMMYDIPADRTYTIRLRARGKGVLWLNVIDLMRDGNRPPTDPVKSRRPRFQTLRVDSADWTTVGARSILVRPHAETVRVSVELRGRGEVEVDDLVFEPDPPLRECPGFTCALDSDTIALGETVVARVRDPEPLAKGGRYRFAFVSPWQSETHETDEETDGRVFRARPVRTGEHVIRAVREDAFGAEAVREVKLTVLPAPPAPAAEPTLEGALALSVGEGDEIAFAEPSLRLRPKLGHKEFLRVKIANEGKTAREVVFRAAAADPARDAAFVCPVCVRVRPGETREAVLPVRTFLNVPHVLEVTAGTEGGRSVRAALELDPEERYPIFGTQDQMDRVPPGRFDAVRDIRLLRELPCQVFRIPDVMMWHKQTVNADGTYAYDFADADLVVNALWREGRTRLHPFLGYVPDDLKPLDVGFRPAKSARYRAYVEAFVERYKGKVRYWEAFNEPPWGAFKDYVGNGGEVLVELQRHLWETVKTKDPEAKLVAPGWCRLSDMEIIEDYLAKGGDRYVDVYDMHEYTVDDLDWRGRTDEEAAAAYLSDAFDEGVEHGLVLTTLRLLRRHGIEKPIFVTECGGSLEPTTELKRRVKGILFLRTQLIWLAAGVAGVEHYEFGDYAHEALPSQYSLIRSGTREKLPLFHAYREIILALTGAASCGAVVKTGDLRRASFVRGGERIAAFWNVGERPATARLELPAGVRAETVTLDPRAREFIVRGKTAEPSLPVPPGSVVFATVEGK